MTRLDRTASALLLILLICCACTVAWAPSQKRFAIDLPLGRASSSTTRFAAVLAADLAPGLPGSLRAGTARTPRLQGLTPVLDRRHHSLVRRRDVLVASRFR